MTIEMRKTGIDVVGDMPWGTHFCLFYETKDDILDTVVPYCKAGLEQHEYYLGLVPALRRLVAEFSQRHGISIAFAHASLPAFLPPDVALCLFRITEESLTNIAKHSQARSATIHLAGASDGIHLRVEDTGTGFDPAAPGSRAGLGLISMQERLRVLHGTIRVDSAPSRGTRIDAWVPATMLVNARHEVAQRPDTV